MKMVKTDNRQSKRTNDLMYEKEFGEFRE